VVLWPAPAGPGRHRTPNVDVVWSAPDGQVICNGVDQPVGDEFRPERARRECIEKVRER